MGSLASPVRSAPSRARRGLGRRGHATQARELRARHHLGSRARERRRSRLRALGRAALVALLLGLLALLGWMTDAVAGADPATRSTEEPALRAYL